MKEHMAVNLFGGLFFYLFILFNFVPLTQQATLTYRVPEQNEALWLLET